MSFLTLTIYDHAVFAIMLSISIAVGFYYGFISKRRNDTTDEYLFGGRRLKTIPVGISLIASQLSSIAIISIPAEIYNYGAVYCNIVLAMFPVTFILSYIFIPIFYQHNLSNCYEYLEMRFDSKTRKIITIAFLLTVYFMIPVIIFIPALAFSQVTGINIHLINGVVCCVCVFYTMLGGIKAVVWTDVVQASVMFGSCILVAIMGIHKVGGFQTVIDRATEGGRLDMFNMKFDLTTRATFWNTFIGSIFMWTGHIGLSQSCVQRIVALPSLGHARRSLIIFLIGYFIIMSLTCFTGAVMYARYFLCDPIKAKLVEKADKLVPFFIQDILGHLKGLPGIFISCVFSAALSTMSAYMNSIAGVVYFDYVRPFINHTEHKANVIMKIIVLITGAYCVLGGLVVEKFGSILQMVITIGGIAQGAVVGVFTLGMLYPKAHGKAAFWSTVFSMVVMAVIVAGSQINGSVKYQPLETKTESCEEFNVTIVAENFTSLATSVLSSAASLIAQNNIEDDKSFSFYNISFNWYATIGTLLVWIVAVPLSHLLPNDKKLDINLISPAARFMIPKEMLHQELPQNDENEKKWIEMQNEIKS